MHKPYRVNEGLFVSDAALLTNNGASKTVDELLDLQDFLTEFSQTMKRMSAIEVLTGTDGEIRKKCSVVNSAAATSSKLVFSE
ncbi:hypothetical protein GIB67_011412 [Kingdonia uniflora]|uniref:Plant heme peroxidase family profile domain-containing protein n=1 Tax=Kingdonia uniflora TaxID=39325 RepID=A0A7J7NLF3_9MAGN|nr:hypothetical protein GIB67_011412 [Kingdonia uniflora]